MRDADEAAASHVDRRCDEIDGLTMNESCTIISSKTQTCRWVGTLPKTLMPPAPADERVPFEYIKMREKEEL
jgi:hypothetical protein